MNLTFWGNKVELKKSGSGFLFYFVPSLCTNIKWVASDFKHIAFCCVVVFFSVPEWTNLVRNKELFVGVF